MWQYALRLNGEEIPEQYPLKHLWDENPERVGELDNAFQEKVNSAF